MSALPRIELIERMKEARSKLNDAVTEMANGRPINGDDLQMLEDFLENEGSIIQALEGAERALVKLEWDWMEADPSVHAALALIREVTGSSLNDEAASPASSPSSRLEELENQLSTFKQRASVEGMAKMIARIDDGDSDFDWESFMPHATALHAKLFPSEKKNG